MPFEPIAGIGLAGKFLWGENFFGFNCYKTGKIHKVNKAV